MLDEHGNLRPEFAADYRVKDGRPLDRSQAERDQQDALANLAPAT